GEGPLTLWSGTVPADWIDYNGHMTESRYLQCCAEATDALLRRLGLDAAYLAGGHSFFTVETHMMHLGQAKLDDRLRVTTQVLGGDAKRLHVFHRLLKGEEPVASAEQMLLHVDTRTDKVVAAEGAMAAAVGALAARHAGLPRPDSAGRSVGAKRGG
ncbi:MAG: thioesterase family protein, partial [Caulobacteraceae bacterium]|nr:thioesterase family protein [Caulobacter sp.]